MLKGMNKYNTVPTMEKNLHYYRYVCSVSGNSCWAMKEKDTLRKLNAGPFFWIFRPLCATVTNSRLIFYPLFKNYLTFPCHLLVHCVNMLLELAAGTGRSIKLRRLYQNWRLPRRSEERNCDHEPAEPLYSASLVLNTAK